jgi:hypothetical protein
MAWSEESNGLGLALRNTLSQILMSIFFTDFRNKNENMVSIGGNLTTFCGLVWSSFSWFVLTTYVSCLSYVILSGRVTELGRIFFGLF